MPARIHAVSACRGSEPADSLRTAPYVPRLVISTSNRQRQASIVPRSVMSQVPKKRDTLLDDSLIPGPTRNPGYPTSMSSQCLISISTARRGSRGFKSPPARYRRPCRRPIQPPQTRSGSTTWPDASSYVCKMWPDFSICRLTTCPKCQSLTHNQPMS